MIVIAVVIKKVILISGRSRLPEVVAELRSNGLDFW